MTWVIYVLSLLVLITACIAIGYLWCWRDLDNQEQARRAVRFDDPFAWPSEPLSDPEWVRRQRHGSLHPIVYRTPGMTDSEVDDIHRFVEQRHG